MWKSMDTEESTVESVSAAWTDPISGLSDDFILGMDASSVLVEENSGVTYHNFDGEERTFFRHLQKPGSIIFVSGYGMTLMMKTETDMVEETVILQKQRS